MCISLLSPRLNRWHTFDKLLINYVPISRFSIVFYYLASKHILQSILLVIHKHFNKNVHWSSQIRSEKWWNIGYTAAVCDATSWFHLKKKVLKSHLPRRVIFLSESIKLFWAKILGNVFRQMKTIFFSFVLKKKKHESGHLL